MIDLTAKAHDAPVGQAILDSASACIKSVEAAIDPARRCLMHMRRCNAALVKLIQLGAATEQDQRNAVAKVYVSTNNLGAMLYPSKCQGQECYKKALAQLADVSGFTVRKKDEMELDRLAKRAKLAQLAAISGMIVTPGEMGCPNSCCIVLLLPPLNCIATMLWDDAPCISPDLR